MGGRPLFGLNIVGWNHDALGSDILVEVLQGVAQAAAEQGWVVIGGHSVDDPEPKVGVAVMGEVHPDRMLTNAGLRAGDVLVLSKPLGAGVITTALKAGAAEAGLVDAAVASMLRSNAEAAAVAVRLGATGATDVTGFGLLGHLRSMVEASQVDAEVNVTAVPVMAGVTELVAAGHVPGGTGRNLAWIRERLEGTADDATLAVLADPQTSGGLLFGVDAGAAAEAVAALAATGHTAAIVGRVIAGSGRTQLA